MQSQEPPVPDGDDRVPGGHARHRRRRTDPPVPPDGMPFIRQEPPPRTVAEYVSRRGDAPRGAAAPPPWAHDRADPHGRLDVHAPASPPAARTSPGGYGDATARTSASDGDAGHDHAAAVPAARPVPRPRPGPRGGDRTGPDPAAVPAPHPDREPSDAVPGRPGGPDRAGGDDRPTGHTAVQPGAAPETPGEITGPVLDRPVRDDDPRTGGGSDPDGWGPAGEPRATGHADAPGVTAGTAAPGRPAAPPAVAPHAGPERGTASRGGVTDDVPSAGRAGTAAAGVAGAATGDGAVVGAVVGAGTLGAAPPGAHPVDPGPHPGGTDRPLPDDRPRDATSGPSLTPSLDAHLEAGRTDPPRRRRGSSGATGGTRTVSDAARERGLPVPGSGPGAEPPGTGHGTGHGHGHGHGPATPAGRRVRILLAALLVPCALAALAGVALLWPGASPVPTLPPQQQVHGDVRAVQAADCTPGSGAGGCTGVTVAMADGPRAGSDLVQLVPAEPSTPRFAVGDRVVLAYSGGNPDEAGSYQITDFQRGVPLVWLAVAFAVAVLLLGRWRGLAALVALGLSFVVLVLFVLPSILSGNNPLAVAVTGAGVIMFLVLYLSHGFSARTSCAVLGTLVSLALIGGLGALFTVTTRLTGLDDTTANLISTIGTVPIDARGLVLAGLVIGALGVLDDVTVTQASAVWEVRDANPSLGAGKLFAAGMRIGRDHVSSAVNTLVLAYAGAALPLMLLFTVSSASVGQVVTSQDVATEIVRTLVGSIGLVASVPVTTGLAALVAARR